MSDMDSKHNEIFKVVSTGSVTGLKQMIAETKPELVTEIVKSTNSQGETPLLLAIKRQNLEMVKYLVEELKADIGQLGLVWNGLKNLTVPPLVSAMMYTSPRHLIIEYLMKQDAADESSVVLNSVKCSNLPQEKKIDLLKLVGAAYIFRSVKNPSRFTFGKKCWSDAMALRSESAIQMIPTRLSELAGKIFGIVEFTTMEKLDAISKDSFSYVQALLIFERIANEINPIPDQHLLFYDQLVELDYVLPIEGPSFCLDILIFALEGFRAGEWEVVINSEWALEIVAKATYFVFRFFNHSLKLSPLDPMKLTFSRLMGVLRCFSDFHLKCLEHPVARVSHLDTKACGQMVAFFQVMPPLNPAQTEEFNQWLSQYMGDINGYSGVGMPLHAACLPDISNPIEVIRLLLNAGASPIAIDQDGLVPLHHLFLLYFGQRSLSAANLLLDAGAQMDQADVHGRTPLDLCKLHQQKLKEEGRSDPHLDAFVKKFLP